MVKLFGTRALVTGGGRGIGKAISLALAEAGADVVISYRNNVEAASCTAAEIEDMGQRAVTLHSEMGDEESIIRLVDETIGEFGGIDILACNAGMHTRIPFLEISAKDWDDVVAADLRGPFLLCQRVARQMVAQGDGGRIIATSSISADVAFPNLAHYQAAKAGLRMLIRGMSLELAEYGILANTVAPGVIETDLTRESLADPHIGAQRIGRIPLGRFGEPCDIATAVRFLASDEVTWMTGSTIVVDGGQTVW